LIFSVVLFSVVMAGLDPAIHVFYRLKEGVDARAFAAP
jgi:hypothetical protein